MSFWKMNWPFSRWRTFGPRTFKVNRLQTETLFIKLLQCVRENNLTSIFGDCLGAVHKGRPTFRGAGRVLMFNELFRSRNLTRQKQLSLALT